MWHLTLTASIGLAIVIPVVLFRAYATVDEDELDSWARARGLELTPDNRAVVATYLRTARVRRTWGVLAALLVPTVVELAFSGRLQVLGFGTDGRSAPWAGPMEAFIGYLLGALYAELSLARPLDPVRRSASLVPRELSDYLPRNVLRAQRAVGVIAVLGVVATAAVPYPQDATEPGALSIVSFGAFLVAFTAALEAVERWLVRRPQPFTSPSLVAADDAIRAQSVHALAGSGLALLLAACSGIFAALASSDVTVLRWTLWPLVVIALVLSVSACLDVSHHAWRVRRRAVGAGGAAPA